MLRELTVFIFHNINSKTYKCIIKTIHTVKLLSIGTKRSEQTDCSLRSSLIRAYTLFAISTAPLGHINASSSCKTKLFHFNDNYRNF